MSGKKIIGIILVIFLVISVAQAVHQFRANNIFGGIICIFISLGSIAGIANIIKDAINDRKRKKRDRQNAEKSQAKQNDKKN